MGSLFAPKSGQAAAPRRAQGIELQRSSYGEVVPLVYGLNRVAPTLLWYGDFTAIKQDQGGKGGGGGVTGYVYTAAVILGICEGPITSIDAVWLNKKRVANIADENLTAFLGASGQAVWSHLTSFYPSQAVPYDFTAYAAGTNIDLGSSAALPNYSFLVRSATGFSGSILDALPSVILTDYLTNAEHGAQFPYLGSLTSWQTYCQATGLFFSPVEQTQRAAAEFLRELLAMTNSDAVWSAGQLRIVPYADKDVTGNGATYTANLTPIYSIDDEDTIYSPGEEPVRLVRKGQSERFNRVRVEYIDKAAGYNTAIAEAWDDADIALNGERPMQNLTFHGITSSAIARTVAQQILQRQLYIVNSYSFRLRADFSLLEPMDLLDLTDTGLGLVNQLVRITSITDEDNDELTLEVEEVPIGVHNSALYNWDDSQGYQANAGIAPGLTNAPAIFVAPPFLVAPEGGTEIWIAASGGANWGGANVWASYDGTDYRLVGAINGPSRHGVTTTTLTAPSNELDTTNTLGVNLADNTRTIIGTTTTNADNLRTLVRVGTEVMSFRDSALVSPGNYNLSYLRRGTYGTANVTHSSGETFVQLDDDVFTMPFDPGEAGQLLYFKFTSFNLYGGAEEELSAVSPYTFTIPVGFSGYSGGAVPLRTAGLASTSGFSAFKKTGSAGYDSSVRTVDAYANGCAFSFTVPMASSGELLCGLESQDSNFTSFGYPKYAFAFVATNFIGVYESGSLVYLHSPLRTPSDTFTIAYDGRTVRYFINGIVVWSSAASNETLFAMASFNTVGAQLSNIRFLPSTGVQVVGGNLTVAAQWRIGGTGTQGNFEDHYNGVNADSSIVLAGGSYPLGPYGQSEALWRAQGSGTGNNGGWNNDGDILGCDPSKSYRTSVWFRWNGTGIPVIAFGCDPTNTNNLGGTANTNPFFFSATIAALGITANKWYLAVGLIHAFSYGTTDLGIAGIYDPATGVNIYNGTEFKFKALVPVQMQRVHQTGANNGGCVTYFSKPRFEEVTGNEPSIATLISPRGALAYLNEVDTAQLAAEAAGAVRTTSSVSLQTVPNTGAVFELLAITLTTTGNPVSIDIMAIVNYNLGGASAALTWLTLTMDGANQVALSDSMNFPPLGGGVLTKGAVNGVRTHTPAAGTHTYRLTAINSNAYGGTPTMSVNECYMKLREYKR